MIICKSAQRAVLGGVPAKLVHRSPKQPHVYTIYINTVNILTGYQFFVGNYDPYLKVNWYIVFLLPLKDIVGF